MASEKPPSKGQAWFCTTGLPSDVIIEVNDMTFHLHKFPLMSKSRKLHDLISEIEAKSGGIRSTKSQKTSDEIEDDDEDEDVVHEDNQYCHITLPDFPGGSEAFEAAAKYCYGVKFDLTSSTVAPLRCAGEYLQMTDDYSENNLVSKTEIFLTQSVLKSFQESIKALRSCEEKSLFPLAEELKIIERCTDAIVTRASAADPSLFGWPVNKDVGGANSNIRAVSSDSSWFEDLARLSTQMFRRLILEMNGRDLNQEIMESCLIYYANKYFPGLSRSNRKTSSSSSSAVSVTPPEQEQRQLLEFITSNLPVQKTSRAWMGSRFLFGLLRIAYILNASDSCRTALEKKIGSQLEQATLDDLLIPSYSYLNETLYDVECVERILSYFLQLEYENNIVRSTALMLVGKLIDGYLSEIASDANLKPEKFYQLAVTLPEHARLFDDGLYRAVDVYLKAHPKLSEEEREKICGVLDCQKLTLEACTHAAQNERLPLRAVVQVLFFEQLQLRQAIAGTLIAADVPPGLGGEQQGEGGGDDDMEEGTGSSTWRSAVRENQVLRLDMDSMRTRVHQLERECSNMKKVIERIDRPGPREKSNAGGGVGGGWRSKFGCKFKTQVCDSHEQPTVVESRKGRRTHYRPK